MPPFAAIYEKYARQCMYLASSFVEKTEAEDVVMESFVKLWERFDNFDTEYKAKAFLMITIKNQCINIVKHKVCTCELIDIEDESNRWVIAAEVISSLHRHIESLPEKQKNVVKLFLDGYTYKEIAVKLGVKEKTVLNQRYLSICVLKGKIKPQ